MQGLAASRFSHFISGQLPSKTAVSEQEGLRNDFHIAENAGG